jgi:branched-chain amino acid transport system substrate-binding protein
MKPWGHLALVVGAAMLSACSTGASGAPPHGTIRIGVDLPLSGHEAPAAEPALSGIRFYVQQHPRLDGFDIALRTGDDAADPSTGAANVRAFVSDNSVVAMIGPYDAAVARQEIPVANTGGLAMVSPATSNPCLTRDVFTPALLNPARSPITCKAAGLPSASQLRPAHTNNYFRLTTTDDLQGAAAADFAYTKLRLLRVAVISDHEAYGQGLSYAFSARFTSLGGTVVGRLDTSTPVPSAISYLKSMQQAGAQAIYYGGGRTAGGCEVRAEMSGIFPGGEATPFLGGDGVAEDPACVRSAGANSAGMFGTVPIVDAETLPSATKTIHDFRAAFGSTSDFGPYTVVAYDTTAVLYAALDQAIRDAGGAAPDRAAVIARLAQTSGFEGATGRIGFDAAGDTTNRVISVFEATGSNPRVPWSFVGAVDYSSKLPY